MKIEHSKLMNHFLEFWFESSVDGVILYETHLDYINKTWACWHKELGAVVTTGAIQNYAGAADEKKEETRIKSAVTQFIQSYPKL